MESSSQVGITRDPEVRSGDIAHLVGALLLLIGLVTALVSNHLEAGVMGKAQLGVAVLAPEQGSPEWKAKERLRANADRWFWTGLVVTAAGILLQTVAPYLPARRCHGPNAAHNPYPHRPVWFLGLPWLCVLAGLLMLALLSLLWVPSMPPPVAQALPSVPPDRWGRLLAHYLFIMLGSHVLVFFGVVPGAVELG